MGLGLPVQLAVGQALKLIDSVTVGEAEKQALAE